MNKDLIKSAYDAMSPDEAARQRMLKRLTDKGGQSVKKEYSAHPQRSGGWIGTLAAILVLALLATGLVTILRSQAPTQLQDDPTETTVPKGNAEEEIEAFMSTPFYQASVEYYEWLQNGESGTYVNRMTKQQEIADRYGLKHYNGDDKGTDNYDYFLEELELKSFLREDVMDAVWSIESCWWYDQSRFNVGGAVRFAGEDSPRATPLDFNFYRTTTEYLLPACGEMGSLENYETWLHPLASGDTAILAMGGDNPYMVAYVIVYRETEVFLVEVTNSIWMDSDPPMTREALEAFADLFTYKMVERTEYEDEDPVQSTVPECVVYPIQPVVDDNSTVAVSLLPRDVRQDDTGAVYMDLRIYIYDQFDADDIAGLEVGEFIFLRGENLLVRSLVLAENGDILINGGAEELGYTLRTDGDGIYYEVTELNTKCWQEYMQTDALVSPDFQLTDISGTCGQVYTLEVFLEMEFDENYFSPYNTTLVLKDGVVISMERMEIS